ncbi:unnamed protein product [Caenorhabditis bovis]|uniref:Seven TM Receptor n=1 Tax=Caenorhabditis bovis TaxID=2654633 RepID=A0A8S1ECR1_9PELO|nr:unnamed protein product [Caenorhabditis bovis]
MGDELNYVLLAIYCGCYGFSIAMFVVNFIYRYAATQGRPFREQFDFNPDNIVYIGSYIYPIDRNGNQYINYFHTIGLLLASILIAFSAFCVIFFGSKCYIVTNKASDMLESKLKKNLHSQLLYALILQTIIPFACIYIPPLIFYVTTMLDQDFQFVGIMLNITLMFYPVVDPLPTIFIVRNYQLATIRFLRNLKNCCLIRKRAEIPAARAAIIKLNSSLS